MAVTRNDVARLAGVSPAVVSYVINSRPRPVSADAHGRVLKAIAELGYRPDGLARSLRLGRSHAIGLVLPDTTNPFFAEMAQAVEDAAYATGYAVLICTTSDDMERERAHIVNLGQPPGRRPDPDERSPRSRPQRIHRPRDPRRRDGPISRRLARLHDPRRQCPRRSARYQASHRARAQTNRHRRRPRRGRSLRSRVKGFQRAMSAAGLSREQVVEAAFDFHGGHLAGHALLTMPDHPDALLISSDVQAIGVLECGSRTRASSA